MDAAKREHARALAGQYPVRVCYQEQEAEDRAPPIRLVSRLPGKDSGADVGADAVIGQKTIFANAPSVVVNCMLY